MRTSTKLGALVAIAATTVGLLAGPAQAVRTHPVLVEAGAGGSKVQAADGTVVSGLTAPSGLDTITLPASSHNEIASGAVGDLIDAGAVTTRDDAAATSTGAQITANAHTAQLSLLGGLITADAVDTTSTASVDGTTLASHSSTTLVNLKITNVDIPVQIPQNFTIRIAGVALIVLNLNHVYNLGNTAVTIGAGVFVRLLGAYGQTPLGTQIFLNSTYAALSTHIPNTPVIVGGNAYGSRLSLNALNLVDIQSGPTAFQSLQGGGTDGQTLTNSTAGVDIPDVLTTGAVQTTVEGTVADTSGSAKTTAAVARVNLLDGLIKVRALRSISSVVSRANGVVHANGHSTLLGLTIGGKPYPFHPAANTVVDVAGLGRVVINEVTKNSLGVTVRALDIILSTARAGLPVGARIELAVASSYMLT